MGALREVSACKVCHRTEDKKPMCFRGYDWCSELHRRVVVGLLTREQADALALDSTPREGVVMP
jgi:hypothetical protein